METNITTNVSADSNENHRTILSPLWYLSINPFALMHTSVRLASLQPRLGIWSFRPSA